MHLNTSKTENKNRVKNNRKIKRNKITTLCIEDPLTKTFYKNINVFLQIRPRKQVFLRTCRFALITPVYQKRHTQRQTEQEKHH